MKSDNHELVDEANFNWFLNMRSQNVPLSASMIQEKAVIFGKELNTKTLRFQMLGYDAGRKEIVNHSRLLPRSRNLSHQRWLMRGRKRPSNVLVKL